MVASGIEDDVRQRCVAACERLVEAIGALDSCGFEVEATHAQLCLDKVWERLDMLGHRSRPALREKPRRAFVPPA